MTDQDDKDPLKLLDLTKLQLVDNIYAKKGRMEYLEERLAESKERLAERTNKNDQLRDDLDAARQEAEHWRTTHANDRRDLDRCLGWIAKARMQGPLPDEK